MEEVLTLPSAKYVRSVSSAIADDFKLTEPAKTYLSARFSKLKEIDHKVSLMMDEVYCQKKVEYSNGRFYGMEGKEIMKTLLCVMIKSICGKYRDVISTFSMLWTPVRNINTNILHTIWQSNIEVLTVLIYCLSRLTP